MNQKSKKYIKFLLTQSVKVHMVKLELQNINKLNNKEQ